MNDHVIMQRIDEHQGKLESALSAAHNELLELKIIHNNEAVPPGYRQTDEHIEDIELLSELVGAVCGALTENGTTTEQDEMLNEILNVLRAMKHLRELEAL